ncbi:SCO6880 family protein [Nocardia sp. AG03]|uniref:SCO6880 family protein n=1 Tax=Nocardia sp. AG03 TaxID=3025312 RepID=UPI0024186DAB|nr:SCO6880 family protein [Nocardia sp. AG03]
MNDTPGYGGFREVKGFGLGRLGTSGTAIIGATVVGLAFTTFIDLMLAFLGLFIAIPVLALTIVPLGDSQRTVVEHLTWNIRAWWGNQHNSDAYAADVLEEAPRGENLPGVLAPLMPLTVEDGRGGTQCLIWNRRTGILSAVLKVSPVGITLADSADTNAWVRNYGSWLADLGFTPIISSVVFTCESSPTGGVDQRAYTLGRMERDGKNAPALAKTIMKKAVEQSRSTTADIQMRVTVNFDLSKASPQPATLSEGAAEVVRWLPRIESALAAAGATVTDRASTASVIRNIRAAVDPAVRISTSDTADNDDELLTWADAGALRTESTKEVYYHDSGYSVTWVFKKPPNSVVRQDILLKLVSPGRYYRRFSLVYRPYSAAAAADIVEREIQGGKLRQVWNTKTKKDETQREYDDRVRARRAAQEESMGAGLGRFTMYVTTTVRSEETLAAACADVEDRISGTKLRFRRARGAQAAAFASSLGYGIEPTSGLSRSAAQRWLA